MVSRGHSYDCESLLKELSDYLVSVHVFLMKMTLAHDTKRIRVLQSMFRRK